MKIFETTRLLVRSLKDEDSEDYFEMMGNPNVMRLIPRKIMPRRGGNQHLYDFIKNYQTSPNTKVWGIETKNENEFIGLCAFLKNKDSEDEIGYRLREKHWRKGYGTEIAEGLISYGFEKLNLNKITADVNIVNLNSVKILEKLMSPVNEFLNESYSCIDRRYQILKKNMVTTILSKYRSPFVHPCFSVALATFHFGR
jgi:RimJ/RimL family protein N-acetyltransferase